jgi:2-polyprenyl-3-methyl-5-hydroxy-6-metoxy-1,4-benzoquinol methylase
MSFERIGRKTLGFVERPADMCLSSPHAETEVNGIVRDYIRDRAETCLEDMQSEFRAILKLVGRIKEITPETQLLEIGIGTGWFQILCKRKGIACRRLEFDPNLARCASELGQRYGVIPDIDIGSIETADIGRSRYDIIIAICTFEHVESWQKGLENVASALKRGGALYFVSTNKFSLSSTEYSIPLYGWLPDAWRYRLRRALQGDEIMKWGIDYNQFTYPQLRREFRRLGFSRVLDRVEVLDPYNLNNPTLVKKTLLKAVKRFAILRHLALSFSRVTVFVCIK